MFVASDGILALLHAKLPQLIEHARSKKVTIVSPTTLVPLLASFKAFRIDYDRNKHVKLIMSELNGLKKEFEKFDDEWRKLNESIAKLAKQSGDVNGRVGRITDKFGQIHLGDLEEKTDESSPSSDASSTVNE
jgi:DNA recombination protein RmuC